MTLPDTRKGYAMAEKTLFEKIIDREIPSDIVYEDDDVIAFKDVNPVAPVHILVVPKKPIPKVSDMEADDIELMGKVMYAAKQVAHEQGVAESGFRLVVNNGEAASQSVFHVHVHLIGGEAMGWPPFPG
jgi:histidine triad (HIT) family protein